MRLAMFGHPATPKEPTSEQLLRSWRWLVMRQHEGGGCLRDRLALAEAVRETETTLLERSWAEPTVDR